MEKQLTIERLYYIILQTYNMATSISTQTTWHAKFLVWGLSPGVSLLGLFSLYLSFTGGASYTLFFIDTLLVLLGIGLFKSYTSNIYTITITQQGVTEKLFTSQIDHSWNEVERIELTGKQRFKYLFSFITPAEAATIYFKNGSQIVLWYSFYQNMSSVCVLLQRADNLISSNGSLDELDFTISPNVPDSYSISDNATIYYTGMFNNYIEAAILLIWPLIGVFTFIAGSYRLIENTMPVSKFLLPSTGVIILCGTLTVLYAKRFNYFILDGDYLIVKNKLFAKWQYSYALDNIQLLVIEIPDKFPHSVRIITKQFENKLYPAGCLNTQKLREFIAALEQRKVPLRNDIESFDYL